VRSGDYLGIRARQKPSGEQQEIIVNTKKILIALSTATVLGLGAASAALASDHEETGGFVMPGSMDGVNPAYHPGLFPNAANGRGAYAYANGRKAYGYANGGQAYGLANGSRAYGPNNGGFVNGNFIPRGTSPAQVPDHVYDEN
jgi:hypothetical protein